MDFMTFQTIHGTVYVNVIGGGLNDDDQYSTYNVEKDGVKIGIVKGCGGGVFVGTNIGIFDDLAFHTTAFTTMRGAVEDLVHHTVTRSKTYDLRGYI